MNNDSPDPTAAEQPGEGRRSRRISGRTLLLLGAGLVLVLIYFTQGCSGVDLEREEAVAIAEADLRAHPDSFEPERIEARILRQGFPPEAMWIVVFTVPDPEGDSEDFLHHAAIWVHAESGDVRQVNLTGAGDN